MGDFKPEQMTWKEYQDEHFHEFFELTTIDIEKMINNKRLTQLTKAAFYKSFTKQPDGTWTSPYTKAVLEAKYQGTTLHGYKFANNATMKTAYPNLMFWVSPTPEQAYGDLIEYGAYDKGKIEIVESTPSVKTLKPDPKPSAYAVKKTKEFKVGDIVLGKQHGVVPSGKLIVIEIANGFVVVKNVDGKTFPAHHYQIKKDGYVPSDVTPSVPEPVTRQTIERRIRGIERNLPLLENEEKAVAERRLRGLKRSLLIF